MTGDATADEGSTHTYSYTVTDPGQDTHTVTTACGTNGAKVTLSDTYNAGTGAGSFKCFFGDGPATTNLTATVTDSDGAADTDNQVVVVTVSNVAPTVTLSASNGLSVNEGTEHTCPADSTVSVQVKDTDDANSNTATQAVHINNVAPVVALSGPNSANPGETKTYTFTITDPAGAADAQSYATGYPTCGLTGTVTGVPTITSSGGSFQCTFAAAVSSTVAVKVNDGNADSNEASIVVSTNRPPTVHAGPDVSGYEGSAISLDGTVSDPDGTAFTVKWTYTAGAGVDTGTTCSFGNDTSVDTTITCTDDGTFTAKLEATDGFGAKSSDTTTVTVSNANPVVTAPNETPAPFAKGTVVSLTVNFTDAGANDTHKAPASGSCTVSWDDGTPNSTGTVTEPVGTTAGKCTASHSYTGPGVYTVTFTVTDDDGGSGTETIQVVVYDPYGGFITGGGFINVGAGSYTANPTLTGRANFGFTSQYKKNAMIPTGETEFNFQVGDMNFHSTA